MSFTLQILHASDLEGGLDAIENAPNFAAVVGALEADAVTNGQASILLSAGDNYIPGPFFNAGGDFSLSATYEGFYNELFGLIDVTVLADTADTNGDGFFDNSEIQAEIDLGTVAFADVYTTDINGDGFNDYFEEIDTSEGRLDVAIMNAMGFDASAIGNHEFDAGTDIFENAINYDSEEGNSLSSGRYGTVNFLQEVDTPGAQFPYLSANLDFSGDFDLGPLFTDEILNSADFDSDLLSARDDVNNPSVRGSDSNDIKVAQATIIEADGEQIGVVGATTQLIASISSPGAINDVSNPGANDMAALAATLQPIIDDLIDGADNIAGTADDLNKVVLVSHLQQFALEQELAGLLQGVDVIIAGGSDTINADDQDRLRTGDVADQPYPAIVTGLDGNPTAIVSTDGEYSYVGRLVVTFDDNGVIDTSSIDENVSGAFATDTQGVLDVTGAATLEDALAASETATQVKDLADQVTGIVTSLDGDIAGEVAVFLNGDRGSVRTQETNFGNLTADANLAAVQAVDGDVVVSIKNGGGIRASIGELVDNGDGTSSLLPTAANPLSGKEAGEVSELDIDNALRFNNGLVTVALTPEELKIILEHGVSATADGTTPGQFPQVGGLRFSFDPEGTAQVLNGDGSVATEGTRVKNVALIDEAGAPTANIIIDGEIAAGAPDSITVVTLNFLAGGGDGYPFSAFSSVTDLGIGEQQALSDFLTDNFPEDGDAAFSVADTEIGEDTRIQNLSERADTVTTPIASEKLGFEIVAEFQGDRGDPDDPEGASEVVAHEDGVLYVTNGANDRIDLFTIPDGTSMLSGLNGWNTQVLHTVGETQASTGALNDLNDADAGYTPVGVMDGIGATALDDSTVRVFVNHELLNNRGNEYQVGDGEGGSFGLLGARISYFDIDKDSREITDSGIAYNEIINADGDVAKTVEDFQGTPFATFFGGAPGGGAQLAGFSRFCSAQLVEGEQFGTGMGLTETIFFAGEEDGSGFNSIGGGAWALDVDTGVLYDVPAFGNGGWENITEIDAGTTTHVAFILSDDTSPFNTDDFGADANGDDDAEAAPLFLYVGEKTGDAFLGRNGLDGGKLFVWVADTPGTDSPAEFNGFGASEGGTWVEIDNTPNVGLASDDGSTGYDKFGYPTQRTLWERAEAEGSFGFSRPEDVATNPDNGAEFVLASTGVDTFDGGVDTFGTLYTMAVDFSDLDNPAGALKIVYDGDADPSRGLRSPDNLDWADDGYIYVQEDEAEEDTLDGEPLFGAGAVNPNEAGIVRIDPANGDTVRVANIDRSVILDPTTSGTPVDTDAGRAGEWESSGILDVSTLFGEDAGTLFIYDVQAHGIEDQEDVNPDSRIEDGDLVEGGQLGLLSAPKSIDLSGLDGYDGVQSVAVKGGIVAVAVSREPLEETFFDETKLVEQPGFVALFDAATQTLLSTVDVGNLPDQLTFSADGATLLVAGEGQFNEDSIDDGVAVDPLGTVAMIDVSDPGAPVANILDFTQFNGFEDAARDAGIRIQDGVDFADDVEPEYIAISPDGTTAFVSLQENNAIAKIDLGTGEIVDVFGLGTVDFSGESKIDADDNGVIDIRNFDNLVGFRMPDAIASFEINGQTYVATANEGDSRDFDEDRVEDLEDDGLLDSSVDTDGLERLEVSTIDGDTDGDGDIDVIHTFSSRSFSIFDADGNLVFDSGPEFEQIIASIAPERFNDDDGDTDADEDRSDAKGPEPEAITIGQVDGDTFAFIGLERDSGIMIYDISDPANATYVNYIPPAFVDTTPEGEVAKHGPEVIAFIPADESATGNAQIAVAYEISGTTVVYDLKSDLMKIGEIQGAGHVSELVGEEVSTSGIVTAVDFNGYYLQDAEGDGDAATSDGIFVFTGNGVAQGLVSVGDEVRVTGTVSEFIPGGAGTGNLSTTQISSSEVKLLSTGNTVAATVIGAAGRMPPSEVVISSDETPVNLQDEAGDFNPETDGIDFYESLEGMLVTVDNPVAVSATNRFDETWVVADDGANVTSGSADGGLNDRGGLNLNADVDGLGDLNPERIQIQYDSFFDLLPAGFTPLDLNLGDDLSDVTGVVSYAFGNFEVLVTEAFAVETPSANVAETTTLTAGDDELTVATYNVLNITSNFDSGDDDDADAAQLALLADQIVNNMGQPDILALQEIQDDSGVNFNALDGVLGADATLQALVDAIVDAGGPAYSFVSAEVDVEGETGGVPGGNIRNAFLYNEARVEGKEFTTLEVAELTELGVSNPTAFDGTRDPLLGVFEFNGEEVILINNHLTSRFGSTPIYGGPQIFVQAGEAEREAETLALNEVVDALLAQNPEARVAVLGDLNTFDFTDELTEDLPGVGDEKVLTNLIDQLPGGEAYTFVFQGNSQVLDHIFVTDGLLDGAQIDVVHVNNDFSAFASDHEPVVASFLIEEETVVGQLFKGGRQADNIEGTEGNDTIVTGRGDDTVNGNGGDDHVLGGRNDDQIDGGADNDTILAGRGDDDVKGGDGDDKVSGGNGEDTIDGGDGDDHLFGARGDDFIDGAAGNDTIVGGRGDDNIDGGEDDDLILGGRNDDFLFGSAGEDTIVGGRGDDIINGGIGDDQMEGNKGDDIFIFNDAFGDDVISGYNADADTLVFVGNSVTDLTVSTTTDGTLITATGEANGTVTLLDVFTFDAGDLFA